MPTFVTIPLFKQCSKCGEEFPNTERYFRKHKGASCRECQRKARQQWGIDNKEKRAAYSRQLNAKNRQQLTEIRRDKYSRDPNFRATIKDVNRTRRARLRKSDGKYTTQDVLKQYDKQQGLCYWCSNPMGDTYHADHIIPISRGGSNWPVNIVVACPHCNCSKKEKLPYIEWIPPNPLSLD